MSTKPLAFLDDAVPEFNFVEGIEGGSYVKTLAEGPGLFALAEEYTALPFRDLPEGNFKAAVKLPTREQVVDYAARNLGTGYNVWQMQEGYGKSSIVEKMVSHERKVVFCARSNNQLVEQEIGFRARWPHLRIHRYVSKGRNLQEELAKLGVPFELTYYESLSPYSSAAVNEPSTRQALRKALDEHGYQDVDHTALFDRVYTTYRAPRIFGKDVDVIMCTLSAFQSFCSSKYRPWWNALGLMTGEKRVFKKHRNADQWDMSGTVPSDDRIVPKVGNIAQRTAEIGLPNITVIIDDPSRTDFDFRRLVEDEAAVDLHHSHRKVPKYQEHWRFTQHWLDEGLPPLLAQATAEYHAKQAQAHDIESLKKHFFEARPAGQHIGYGLQRGYGKGDNAPGILVLTTEHVTTKLAVATFRRLTGRTTELTTFYMPLSMFGYPKHSKKKLWDEKKEFKAKAVRYKIAQDAIEKNCHVTLLTTKLVRRSDRVLLLLIVDALREEFPMEDLMFIADGLGCELNLSNNRGRNDLTDRASLIKLSIPHRDVSVNLWAQFPKSEKPAYLNTVLLADLANQAIGRNQGNRFRGKPCMVLIDPMYAKLLLQSNLLRYATTPWSFNRPTPESLPLHGPVTPIEARLMALLVGARNFGMGRRGMTIGFALPGEQRRMYEDWLDRNGVAWRHLV